MEYRIRKSGESCSTCERVFEEGDELVSSIVLAEEEPQRRDACLPCFDRREVEPDAEFAYWRTRKSEVRQRKPIVDFNTLRELFFRMAQNESDEYRKITYLLGLVLIRKRSIRLKEFVTEQGRDFLLITTKERPEPLKIEAPELEPAEFAELRDKLRQLLDIDFEAEGLTDARPGARAPAEAEEPPGSEEASATGERGNEGDAGDADEAGEAAS